MGRAVRLSLSAHGPEAAVAAFNPHQWHDDIRESVEAPLRAAALKGARAEWAQHGRRRGKSAPAAGLTVKAVRPPKMPPAVQRGVDQFVKDTLAEDYWPGLADSVKADLERALKDGLDAGESGDDLADRVKDVLGPEGGKARAERIARTEATGALNAGADATRGELADLGLVTGKTWLAVLDKDTRDDHEEANGQTVGVNDPFKVGGEECAYPGDVNLSAGQRVNCRCVAVSVAADEESAAEE